VRDDVDLPLLSELQRTKNELGVAMHGFISWAAENYEGYKTLLPEKRREYRERLAPSLAGSHPRTPTMVAALMVGFRMFATFATATCAITTEERELLLARGETAIVQACRLHTENTAGEDPATRFLDILRSLFSAERAYAKDAEYGCHPDDWAELGWESRETQDGEDIVPGKKATFIGWVDEEFVYLDKDPAYATVSEFVQRGGIPFGIKPRTLWQSLKRAGLTLCSTNRTDTTKRIEGKTRRVVQLRRSAILGGEDDG